jgi:hypothetical protein
LKKTLIPCTWRHRCQEAKPHMNLSFIRDRDRGKRERKRKKSEREREREREEKRMREGHSFYEGERKYNI